MADQPCPPLFALGEVSRVIKVRRLNQTELVVNADLIEFIEATPDTVISLTTGKKLVVLDSVDEIVSKVIKYRKSYHAGPFRLKLRKM